MSETPKGVDPNQISILSIRTLRGNIEPGNIGFYEKAKMYNFEFKTDVNIEREKKLIRLVLEITIRYVDAKQRPASIAGSYTTEFVFFVGNMEALIQFDEVSRTAGIDGNLSVTLASIAYSTMRGIINTRTQGTVLNGVILPVIDPVVLIQNQIMQQQPAVTQ
jgi:hypothetical protein